MANKKVTLSANGSKGNHEYTLTVEETATNATKNTSTVTINFSLTHIHSGYNWQDHSSVKGTVTVNGTSYSWALPNYDGSGEAKLITNKTQTITHKDDGSKSISVSFSCKADTSYSYLPGTASASGTLALTTLARASSFSVANGTLGSSQSITVTKKNKSYGHTISAKVGSLAAQTVVAQSKSGSSGTSVTHTWTPPKSFASANTKGKTVSATLTLQAYSGTTGTTKIGDAVTKTITYTIPSDVKCEISGITFDDATKYSSSETLLSHFGGYIQGKSKVVATVTTSNSNAQGATPTKAEITANGITYSSDKPSSGKFVITTNVVSKYGNDIEVASKLTDSRGMTDVPETASTIKVFQYFDPKIANFSVGRCTKSGSTYTEDDSGSSCIIKIKPSFAPLTGATVANTAKAKLTYRIGENGAETIIAPPSDKTADSDGYFPVENDIDINNIYFDNAKQDTAYIITLSVKDAVGTITTVSRPLSTAVSIMDFPETGEAMGIGKVVDSTRQSGGNLDIGWNTYIKDVDMTIPDNEYTNLAPTPAQGEPKKLLSILKNIFKRNSPASGGTALSMVNTGDMYTWNNKASTAVATTSAAGLMSAADKTKLNAIGTIFPDDGSYGSFANKTVTSTETNQYWNKFTLPSTGVWIVDIFVDFSANTTGYRYLAVLDSAENGASANAIQQTDSQDAPADARGRLRVIFIYKATTTAERTIPIGVAQTSGSSLTARCRYRAVKISN